MDTKTDFRATMRSQVKNCSLKHNSHEHLENANVYYSSYVDFTKVIKNPSEEDMMTDELQVYEKYFKSKIDKQNQKYAVKRQYKNQRTVKDFYDRNPPEETIYQIGNQEHPVTANELVKVLLAYNQKLQEWSLEHNDAFTILGYTLHVDEGSVHVHQRRVWHVKDENGDYVAGYTPTLRQLGYARPHPEKKENRYNNPKMMFDKEMRELWYETVKEHGFAIETTPAKYKNHEKTKEYQAMLDHVDDVKQEKMAQIQSDYAFEIANIERKSKMVDEMLDEETAIKNDYKAKLERFADQIENIADRLLELAKKGDKEALKGINASPESKLYFKELNEKKIKCSVFSKEDWVAKVMAQKFGDDEEADDEEYEKQ